MKKLYALLMVLIVIYVLINLGSLNLDSQTATDVANDASVAIGGSTIENLDNFTATKVNDTVVSLVDSNNITINVSQLDNSQDISEIVSNAFYNLGYTSNQTLDQNGTTVYYLYNEDVYSYGADIYFNKDGQNFLISGADIPYENSDYFINACKGIIDSLNVG